MGEHEGLGVEALKQAAAIEIQGFDNLPLRVPDRVVHTGGVDVDEARGDVADQPFEPETIFQRRPKLNVGVAHGGIIIPAAEGG